MSPATMAVKPTRKRTKAATSRSSGAVKRTPLPSKFHLLVKHSTYMLTSNQESPKPKHKPAPISIPNANTNALSKIEVIQPTTPENTPTISSPTTITSLTPIKNSTYSIQPPTSLAPIKNSSSATQPPASTAIQAPLSPPQQSQQYIYVVTEVCTPPGSRGDTWNATHGVFSTLALAKRAAYYIASDIKKRHFQSNKYDKEVLSREWISGEGDGTMCINVDWLDTVIDVERMPLCKSLISWHSLIPFGSFGN